MASHALAPRERPTGQMLFNAIQFASYASVKDVTTEGGKKQTGLAFAAAGGVTGFFVTLVEGPQVSLGPRTSHEKCTPPHEKCTPPIYYPPHHMSNPPHPYTIHPTP